MKKRVIFDLVLLGAVFYTPWWTVAILASLGAFLLPPYYEIIAFGIIIDILYGARSLSLGGMLGTVAAFIIFLTASYAKKAVR